MYNEIIFNKVKRNSEEKIKYAISAYWLGNILLFVCSLLILIDIINITIGLFNSWVGLILYFVIVILISRFFFIKKIGIGISNHRFVYVEFKVFGYNEKKVYDVPFDKFKYFSIRKIFNLIIMKVSFLDDFGTLQRKKIYFNYKKIGPGSSNYNENSKEIYIKLIEIQKVLDKGDF